jgi:hypothetical protein
MGFTIGGLLDMRSGTRRRGRCPECTAVAEYTGLWRWDVVPGARARRGPGDGPGKCSCGAGECPSPGAHPLASAPEVKAGATLDDATAAWSEVPGAAVLLPVGRSFDVIEVAEPVGRRALVRLERMGLPVGPVVVTPHGRAQFFVAPGTTDRLPALLYRMGWDYARLDLHGLGEGRYVTAPPSDLAGLGPVRWMRPPTLDTAARPPQVQLIFGTLAYVCHRSAA